jgi:hypothetical protein
MMELIIMTLVLFVIGAAECLVISGPASEFERRQVEEYKANKSKKEAQP